MAAGDLILTRRNDSDTGTVTELVPFSAGQTITKNATGRPTAQTSPTSGTDDESAGFIGLPVVTFVAATALAAAHIGKCLLHLASDANARTVTIPANASVALPVGFRVEIHNQTAELVTVAITTDTLTLSPAGTTGSVVIEQDGRAILHKISATGWVVYGFGVAAPE